MAVKFRFILFGIFAIWMYLESTALEDFTTSDRIPAILDRIQEDRITNLPQGALFKKKAVLDMSSSIWPHVFTIPHPPEVPPIGEYEVCNKLPVGKFRKLAVSLALFNITEPNSEELREASAAADRMENKIMEFCELFKPVEKRFGILKNQTVAEILRHTQLYKNLVLPTKQVPYFNPGSQPLGDAPYSSETGQYDHLDQSPPVQPLSEEDYLMLHDSPDTNLEPGDDVNDPLWTTRSSVSFTHSSVSGPDTSPNPHRDKRAFLSFLGENTGNWFGLASTKDLRKLWHVIDQIHGNSISLADGFNKLENDMMSMSLLERKRVNRLSATVVAALRGLDAASRRIKVLSTTQAIDEAYDKMVHQVLVEALQAISMMEDAMHNYLAYMQERCTALISLNANNMLLPSLVPPSQLKETLADVETVLLKDYVPFRFATTDPDYFYSVPSTTYLADRNNLYVEIKIPLTVLDAYYQVYEVHTVPMPVGEDGTQFTQIKGLPKYVAFSQQGDTYTMFNEDFLSNCDGLGVQRCYERKMEMSTLVPSCVLGLFLDDKDMIKGHCKADLLLTPSLPESAVDLGHGKFFISAMNTSTHWTISCNGRKPRALLSCRSCVVSLDCRCNLKTPNAFISASLGNCPNASSSSGLTKEYIPNQTWIQRLPEYLTQNITQVTPVAPNHPVYKVPHYSIPTYEDIQDFVDKDTEVRTDLDHILQQAERKQPIYISKLQQLQEETTFSLFKTHHAVPLALASLAWDAVLTFLLVILFRKGGSALLLGKLSKSVTGSPVESTTGVYSLNQLYCTWYVAILLSVYVLWVIISKIIRHRRKEWVANSHYPIGMHDQLSTDVYLKFWTPHRLAIIRIDHVLAPQQELTLQGPREDPDEELAPVYVTYDFKWYSTVLVIHWKNNRLAQVDDNYGLLLPPNAPVPASVSSTLIQIMDSGNFKMSMLLRTGPDQREIPLQVDPTCHWPLRHVAKKNYWPCLGIRRKSYQKDQPSIPDFNKSRTQTYRGKNGGRYRVKPRRRLPSPNTRASLRLTRACDSTPPGGRPLPVDSPSSSTDSVDGQTIEVNTLLSKPPLGPEPPGSDPKPPPPARPGWWPCTCAKCLMRRSKKRQRYNPISSNPINGSKSAPDIRVNLDPSPFVPSNPSLGAHASIFSPDPSNANSSPNLDLNLSRPLPKRPDFKRSLAIDPDIVFEKIPRLGDSPVYENFTGIDLTGNDVITENSTMTPGKDIDVDIGIDTDMSNGNSLVQMNLDTAALEKID